MQYADRTARVEIAPVVASKNRIGIARRRIVGAEAKKANGSKTSSDGAAGTFGSESGSLH